MTSTESGTAPLGAGRRCPWAEHAGPAELAYHDLEWGVPHHGDRALFELLSLEGAQAGLSWSIVLGRREGYRRAFAGFDPDLLATWTDEQIDGLLRDAASNSPPREDRLRSEQRQGPLRPKTGGQGLRRLRLVVHRRSRPATATCLALRCPDDNGRGGGARPRPQTAGFPLCRSDHRLCLHAGGRHDERPPHELLPLGGAGWLSGPPVDGGGIRGEGP